MSDDMVRPAEADLFGRDLTLAAEMIVTGRKVGADRHFYSTLAHDPELFGKIVQLVNTAQPRKWTSIKKAFELLGEDRVVTPRMVAEIYKVAKSQNVGLIPYSEQTLKDCARQNKRGKAIWYLVWFSGRSLVDQLNAQTAAGFSQFKENHWWVSEEERTWSNFRPQPGFQLINFKFDGSVLRDTDYRFWREKMINGILAQGAGFVPAHEAIVNEAVFMIRRLQIEETDISVEYLCIGPPSGPPYYTVFTGGKMLVIKNATGPGKMATIMTPEYVPKIPKI